jgi:hypothetical protein
MQREPKFATVVDGICRQPTLRRQFLWLRAQEKDDMETVRDLEAVDPALSSHMAALVAAFEARGNRLDTPDERRRSFGRMQDELFEQYAKTLE